MEDIVVITLADKTWLHQWYRHPWHYPMYLCKLCSQPLQMITSCSQHMGSHC